MSPRGWPRSRRVSPGYPLRGAVSIAAAPNETGSVANSVPAPGTVWIDPQLLDTLHVKVGGALKVGTRQFTVAALITRELDRGFAFVNFSPRVMLRADDLPSTGLLSFGSRATYRLLVAGSPAAVARYTAWAHEQVDGNRLRGVGARKASMTGQPQVRDTLAPGTPLSDPGGDADCSVGSRGNRGWRRIVMHGVISTAAQ